MNGDSNRRVDALCKAGLVLGRLALISTLLITAACSRQAAQSEERLPGRSRPLLRHDWPHPRDYQFAANEFAPPVPGRVLITTPTGVRAFVMADDAAPIVRFTAALPLGRLYERQGEAGAAGLLVQILTRDDVSERPMLSERLEDLGTRIDTEEELDLTRLTLDVLPEDWREGLGIMVDVLRRPDVDPLFVRAYSANSGYVMVTAGVTGQGFRPKVELERRLVGYPLAPPDPHTRVSPEAVRAIAARTLRPDAVVLAIGGSVPRADVEAALNELTAGWRPQTDQKPVVTTLTPDPDRRLPLQTIDDTSLEGWIAIGRAIGPVSAADRPALAVLSEILNIRLNIAARETRGLANRTSFEIPETGNGSGLVLIRSGGRTEAVAPLVKVSFDEISRITRADDPISPDEMEQSKGILTLGRWQGALDGALIAPGTFASEVVRYGGTDRLMKWPDLVTAVTPEQVKTVATKYLRSETMAAVVVGPLEKIRAGRHPRWPANLDELASHNQLVKAGQ